MSKYSFASRVFGCAVVLVSSAFLFSATASATSPIGATPGAFAVSPTGAATYTIPIAVPPGTAGMEPKLALSYNSQGGNGLLGMGWSLSGLSAITGCPKTVAQDGVKGGVNLDSNDRLCLDGQRLIVISAPGGNYWANGAEYRTEIESFTRVIANSDATCPIWFKAWTKSGQIMEFGHTADSCIEAQGKANIIRAWPISKITDTAGSYLTITYAEDTPNGQYVPTRVDYTGNVNTGAPTKNSVQFSYIQRPDIVPFYMAGSLIQSTMRMTNIQTYAGATLIRNYQLAYSFNAANNTSRLGSVTECAGDGACLPPTTFAWQAETTGNITQPNTWWPGYGAWCDPSYMKLNYGDFNGDGRQDMICQDPTNGWHIIAFSNGDGTFGSPGWWQVNWCDPAHLNFGDFNGDGKTDMMCNRPSDGRHLIAFSNGDGTFSAPGGWWPGYGAWCDPSYMKLNYGDFNGDGRQDMICQDPTNGWHIIAFSNGDGTFGSPGWWQVNWCDPAHLNFGDFNGDGKTDMICNADAPDGRHIVALSNGDGTFSAPGGWWPINNPGGWCDPAHLKFGDFNGDGKTDMICNADAPDGRHIVALSNGDGTFSAPGGWWPINNPGGWCDPAHLKFGDFNGDGKQDMMCNSDDGRHIIAFSKGDGTFTSPGWMSNTWCDPAHLDYGDFNGDGKTDLICNNPDGRHLIALEDAASNVVASVTNGLSAVAALTYKPLTDPTIYTKGTSAAYPVMDLQAPIYVVTQASSSNGAGGAFNTTYTYGGAKADLSGRGFLGFAWQQALNTGTNISGYTEYAQSFPYTGIPTKAVSKLGAQVLKQTTNTLATFGPQQYTGVTFPYISQSVETATDLNGAALPTVTTATQYDTYGNPANIAVSTGDGYSKTTVNTYDNDTTRWLLGRLRRSTVTSTTP